MVFYPVSVLIVIGLKWSLGGPRKNQNSQFWPFFDSHTSWFGAESKNDFKPPSSMITHVKHLHVEFGVTQSILHIQLPTVWQSINFGDFLAKKRSAIFKQKRVFLTSSKHFILWAGIIMPSLVQNQKGVLNLSGRFKKHILPGILGTSSPNGQGY